MVDDIIELKKDAERAFELGDKSLSLNIYRKIDSLASKSENAPVSEWEDNPPVEGMKPSMVEDLRKNVSEVGKQYLENLYSGYNTLAGVRQGLAAPFVNVGNAVSDALPPTKLSDLITDKEQRFALPGIPLENPNATSYGVGKLAGETAITAPVGGVLATGARTLKAPEALARSIETYGTEMGGFGKNEKLASILRGVVGGGLTGGVSTALTNPNLEDIGLGGAVGAIMPHGAAIVGTGATKAYDLLKGKLAEVNAGKIARQVLGENLPATREALLNAPQDLTAAQAAYGKATPAFASLEGLASSTRGEPYLAKQARQEIERAQSGNAIIPDMQQALANENRVIANRTGQLTQGQDVIDRSLANQVRGFEAKTTKGVSQVPHGEIIAGQKNALEQGASNAVKPLYAQAFDLAPQKFDVANVATAAENIKGHLASIINPDTKPEIADAITKVFQSTPATKGREVTNLATGNKYMTGATPAIPPQASLQDLDEVSKGITAALSDARMAASPDNTLISNLNNLKTEVNKAISANVSDEALAAYDNAKKVWLKTVHEPFREGEVRKLTKENVSGRPMTLPENAAKQFLSSESGAADFNRAFGNDPDAKEALNSGIEHLMLKAKNPETFLTDNKLKLDELGKTNPDLQPRLDKLAEQLRVFKGVEDLSTAERKLIPEKVAEEVANASSTANQGKIMEKLMNKLNPYAGKENPAAFLAELEKTDLSPLSDFRLAELNATRAKLLRDMDLTKQAEAGRGTLKKAWDENTFMQKLPSYLNAATSTTNKALGIAEKKLASAIELKLSKGMESPEDAIKMLDMMPADQRDTIIRALRQSGPTISRAAVLSLTQNKD
jgi:hypothetical protein